MKSIIKISILVFIISHSYKVGLAQNKVIDTYDIELSQPNRTGKLVVDLHNGTLQVEGHNGKEVIVQFVEKETNQKDQIWSWGEDGKLEQKGGSKKGLKKLSTNHISLEIEEHNNTVFVKGSHNQRSDLVIKVPTNFSLQLKTHHNGSILVKEVIGDHEITAHHGKITMEDIGGSVIADTHHGAITASLVSVVTNVPMAFSTYHGDVDITLPSSVKCDTKIKTVQGDVYTDFELELKNVPERTTSNTGRRQIKIGGWMYGKIGNGGAEFLFNTHHGDVVIRQL